MRCRVAAQPKSETSRCLEPSSPGRSSSTACSRRLTATSPATSLRRRSRIRLYARRAIAISAAEARGGGYGRRPVPVRRWTCVHDPWRVADVRPEVAQEDRAPLTEAGARVAVQQPSDWDASRPFQRRTFVSGRRGPVWRSVTAAASPPTSSRPTTMHTRWRLPQLRTSPQQAGNTGSQTPPRTRRCAPSSTGTGLGARTKRRLRRDSHRLSAAAVDGRPGHNRTPSPTCWRCAGTTLRTEHALPAQSRERCARRRSL